MDESWHTCKWVMSHMWISLATHMNESCRTYKQVISHIWMGHVTHTNTGQGRWERRGLSIAERDRLRLTCCRTCPYSLCLSHITHIDESCHTCEWGSRLAEQDRLKLTYCGKYSTMGWLWLVDPLKLSVSFAKEPYKTDDILQKRPVISRSLLIVATP